ncbi:MAG: helix-turn-helix domain-containing protein [Opitutales bacterium]|nr:helix-turn-helix domain-containing protein [Opitutales bacterium]
MANTIAKTKRPRAAKEKDLPEAPMWLRPAQIEALYGIKSGTLRNLVKIEGLPATKLRSGRCGVMLVKRADLEAFLEARCSRTR